MSAHAFTLYDMLSRNALIYGDRPAVIHAQGRLTFRDFLARVDALAAGLAALPLVKGERLCILAQNHPAYLELYGACARLGVHNVELLGYHDSGMPDWDCQYQPNAFCNIPIEIVANQLVELLDQYRPDVVVTYNPEMTRLRLFPLPQWTSYRVERC